MRWLIFTLAAFATIPPVGGGPAPGMFEDCSGGATGGEVDATCSGSPEQPVPRPDGPPAPACVWVAASYGDSRRDTIVDTNTQAGDGVEYYRLTNGGIGRTLPDGTTQKGVRRVCDDPDGGPPTVGPISWVNVTSIQDLINASVIKASRQIPLPTPGVNPPPEGGGYVNFGMWLAVGNPDPISVTANSGGMWARTTATIASTVFEMGNGDRVECDGHGTPLQKGDPGWDSDEPGPCGYTYTEIPPAEPYQITVTTTWEVTWETSTGTTGTANPILRTATFDYKVREIQTVGIAATEW